MAEGNGSDISPLKGNGSTSHVGAAAKIGFVAIGLIIGVLLGIAGTILLQNHNPKDKQTDSEVLAASVVFERIQSQNELVSASQKYNIVEKVGNVSKIPFTDIPIPWTENSYWYRYVGTLKVGVDLSKASFNESGNTLTIKLPQPSFSSNTPDRELSGVLEENNNIFNPIHIEDVDHFLAQCQQVGEENAVEDGIMDEARNNAEEDIRAMFNAAFGDAYKVEFVWEEA